MPISLTSIRLIHSLLPSTLLINYLQPLFTISLLMRSYTTNHLITNALESLVVCVTHYFVHMASISLSTGPSHAYFWATNMQDTSVSTLSPTKPISLAMWSLMRPLSRPWIMPPHFCPLNWLLKVTLLILFLYFHYL
jgi:hypothetical protein